MASTDDLIKTGKPGLFYREHPTRKHGVRKDRQWVIRQTLGGKTRVSTLGWWGTDKFSEGDATNKADHYKANFKWNKGNPSLPARPVCKADEDAATVLETVAIERQHALDQRENITIDELWNETYLPIAEQSKKKRTMGTEKALYNKWIKDSLGGRRLIDLTQIDYTRLIKQLTMKKLSARTVHYVFSVLLQIWSVAFDSRLVAVQPPRRKTLKLPDIDNARDRAFTVDEAELFFAELKKKSAQWHDISLLSLLTGMRASEVYKLKLQDIDLEHNQLFLRSPKKSKSQYLQISDDAKTFLEYMLKEYTEGGDYLLVNKKGEQIKEVSDSIERVIADLGLNEGVEPKRHLTFHSLRHTTATWLLEQRVDIYRVSKLLRHSSVRVTELRYAHLSNDTMKRTADRLGGLLSLDDKTGNADMMPVNPKRS